MKVLETSSNLKALRLANQVCNNFFLVQLEAESSEKVTVQIDEKGQGLDPLLMLLSSHILEI